LNLRTEFDYNRTKNGSAPVHRILKMSSTGNKLTHMRVYCFRCYWPSNLIFAITCVTYVSNLRKIGQKTTVAIVDDHTHTHRQTHRQTLKWFCICPMPYIACDWFVGVKGYPHFRHAFSNRTYFPPCGRVWSSSVQRVPRVADEKEEEERIRNKTQVRRHVCRAV